MHPINLEYLQFGKDKNYIAVCTNGPLTYLRTLKNASSFFYNSLTENFQWRSINYNEISWHETHVFSHIQDPVERRHKGVLEHIIMNDCTDLLMHNTQFQRLVQFVPCLDEHTASLHDMYGSCCHTIDWIPLYPKPDLTIIVTQKLLAMHGQRAFPWSMGAARPASKHMRHMAQLLRDLWQQTNLNHTLPGHTRAYLVADIDLYNKVMARFNPHGDTWQQCSWLRQD